MTTVGDSAPPVLRSYYDILTGGIEHYGEGASLSPLLVEDLEFEGPIAGRVVGARRFLHGVRGFVANVDKIEVIQEVHDESGSAVVYDAHLPRGVVRFTEFFRLTGDRIGQLRLLYDPADYLAKGGA